MKLHWGNALFLFFVAYIGLLGFTLYQSTQVNHSLVSEDYYAKDLAYQEQYNKIVNYKSQKDKVTFDYNKEKHELVLKGNTIAQHARGQLTCYHPVSSGEDVEFDFDLKANEFIPLSLKHLPKGRWVVQMDYAQGEDTYYYEEEIFIR
jgi:hypothetical protein